MANTLYDLGREAFLGNASGQINWTNDNIKCSLVDTGTYTFSQAHQYYSSITGVVGSTSGNFASKTISAGVADAADITFTSVSGVSAEAIIIYKDTGVAGTSPLIAYIDTATGLPVTPNGGNITVAWDSGTNRIFKL